MQRPCSLVAISLLCAAAALAQSDRGTITGTVSDSAGAVVPGAVVVATNSETGVQSRTVTTSTGNYTIPSLPVGLYDVSVEVPGFKKHLQRGIKVRDRHRGCSTAQVGRCRAK